jgi:hypothetical protein
MLSLAEISDRLEIQQLLVAYSTAIDLRIDGDTASSRSICFNPMLLGGDQQQVLFRGLWYDDAFVRTADGWRMTRRVETKCFEAIL